MAASEALVLGVPLAPFATASAAWAALRLSAIDRLSSEAIDSAIARRVDNATTRLIDTAIMWLMKNASTRLTLNAPMCLANNALTRVSD